MWGRLYEIFVSPFIMVAVSVLITTILFIQGFTFNFQLEIVPLIAFYVFTDLFRIKKSKIKLVTNFAGAVPIVVFGAPYFLPFIAFSPVSLKNALKGLT